VAKVIGQLEVGEALVSTLQEKGVPMPVQRTLISPPRCRMGALTPEERNGVRARSPIGAKYDARVNRESAYEILGRRAAGEESPAIRPGAATRSGTAAPSGDTRPQPESQVGGQVSDFLWGTKRRQGMVETMAKQAARTVGSQIGRQILRSVLGGILGGARRR